MSLLRLPPIASVPTLKTSEQAAILDHLFEPCAPLRNLSVASLQEHIFESYDHLIGSIGIQLTHLAESSSTTDTQLLDSILGSHPRLGEKTIESIQSRKEQAQLALDGGDAEEKLSNLNSIYEETFAGLRYVYVRIVDS